MFKQRRKELVAKIFQQYGVIGPIVLIANFENECCSFRQESSFYYYTGVNEPGCAVIISPEGEATLYIPNFQESRRKWLGDALDSSNQKITDIDHIEYLGELIKGYYLSPAARLDTYSNLLLNLQKAIEKKKPIYTIYSQNSDEGSSQKLLLWRFFEKVVGFNVLVKDISFLIARMRQKKSSQEVSFIKKAIDVTCVAQKEAERYIKSHAHEAEVHMALEKEMRRVGALTAFPSIVAGGKNSCILHYTKNYCSLNMGEVVVVDIGAQVEGYCADITRTYPVAESFTTRQQEIYDLVLAAQKYIEGLARPGVWLSNKNEPDQSLHHLAVKFLTEQGYGKNFTHGIGHFLGLDVHDVGDYTQPLSEGDVITIEPGIYIPSESIGVRIEDDYLITFDGNECLSKNIPK